MGELHKDLVGDNLHISKALTGSGSPTGSVTAGVIGQLFWDNVNSKLFVADEATDSDWVYTGVGNDTLAEILVGGNTTAGTDLIVSVGDMITINDPPIAKSDAANKEYVDDTFELIDTLAKILANGNTTGGTDLIVSTGDEFQVADTVTIGSLVSPPTDVSLYLSDPTKAFLVNSGTELQRDEITPTEGMQYHNIDANDLEFYNGTVWQSMGGGDLVGPASSTNTSVPTYSGTTGKLLQDTGKILISSFGNILIAQQLVVGDQTPPNSDASIDLQSTTGALLLNRLNQTQLDLLGGSGGLILFNAIELRVEFHNGTAWQSVVNIESSLSLTNNFLVRGDGADTVDSTGLSTDDDGNALNVPGNFNMPNDVAPTVRGSIQNTGAFESTRDIVVGGQYAYMPGFSADSINVIDITDPDAPVIIGTVSDGSDLQNVSGVFYEGNHVYARSNNRFTIIDVSVPDTPTIVGVLQNNASLTGDGFIYVAGRYAYVTAFADDAITIIDISDPTTPVLKGVLQDATNLNQCSGIHVVGNYAYVASIDSDSLSVIDISDPDNPFLASVLLDPTNLNGARGVYVSGRYAYVTGQVGDTFATVDISDPTAPALIDVIAIPAGPTDLRLAGNFAYICSQDTDQLVVVDISDPTSLTLATGIIDGTNLDSAYGIAIAGKYAYIACLNADRFTIVELTGADIPSANIGTIKADDINVTNDIILGNQLFAGGVRAGPNGIHTDGKMSNVDGTVSADPVTTMEIFTAAQLEKLATAGVITITTNTLIIWKNNITSDTEFVLVGGAVLHFSNNFGSSTFTYSGTGTFISGVGSFRSRASRVASSSTGTLFDISGGTINIDASVITGWNWGTATDQNILLRVSSLSQFKTGLNMVNCRICDVAGIGVSQQSTNEAFLKISGNENDLAFRMSRSRIATNDAGSSFFQISPGLSENSIITASGVVITGDGSFFDTTETATGVFTSVSNESRSSHPITGVNDDSGDAQFEIAASGSTIEVGQLVTHTTFGESTYNGTFIVTISTGYTYSVREFLETDNVAFVLDETGTLDTDSIEVTDAAHGLSNGDAITMDTDLAVDYDGGFEVYAVATNTFRINVVHTSNQSGTWSDAFIDQVDNRILTSTIPGFANSKYIATAFVNDNTTATGSITNGAFTEMVFGTAGSALQKGSTMERFKLLDDVNGTFEYMGNEPFDGSLAFDFTVESSGGTVDFVFKWLFSDDGGALFKDLDDIVQSLVAVGSEAQSVTKTIPLRLEKGDQIRPHVTRNSGTSGITSTHATIYATG